MRGKAGFTILELIIVIGIIIVLMAASLIGYSRMKKNSREARAKSDMLALGQAVNNYHLAHEGDVNVDTQWPGNAGINIIPTQLTDGGYWGKSENLTTGIKYLRSPVSGDLNYVVVIWAGEDGDVDTIDDGILPLFSADNNQSLLGLFKINLSGHEEACDAGTCKF